MVIAIDGPAGSGKSTIARMLAKGLGYSYINSGRFYRALTLKCLRKTIDFNDRKAVEKTALDSTVSWADNRIFLDGEDVDSQLQTDLIDLHVAALSSIIPIRHKVNALVREIALNHQIVVEGRDMTTVVFPDAEFAFYLDASPESRARRRYQQGVSSLTYEEILKSIIARDELDKNKEEGSLKIAPHVEYLDSSDLTIEQVYDRLVRKIQL